MKQSILNDECPEKFSKILFYRKTPLLHFAQMLQKL